MTIPEEHFVELAERLRNPSSTIARASGDPVIDCALPIFEDTLEVEVGGIPMQIENFKFAALPGSYDSEASSVTIAG